VAEISWERWVVHVKAREGRQYRLFDSRRPLLYEEGREINNYGLSDKEAKEFRGEKHCR
jgi:hypothetical protein